MRGIEDLHESQTGPSGALPGLCNHEIVTEVLRARGRNGPATDTLFTALTVRGERILEVHGEENVSHVNVRVGRHDGLQARMANYQQRGFPAGETESIHALIEDLRTAHEDLPKEIQP